MHSRLTLIISDGERKALQSMAASEMRPLRDQARYILRQVLIERGLLPAGQEAQSSGNGNTAGEAMRP